MSENVDPEINTYIYFQCELFCYGGISPISPNSRKSHIFSKVETLVGFQILSNHVE